MDNSVSVATAKAHLSEILDRVERGDEVTITRRGKPVARLHPAKPTSKGIDWERLRKFRESQPKSKESVAKMVRKMRDEGW